jgi:hypothetical protein
LSEVRKERGSQSRNLLARGLGGVVQRHMAIYLCTKGFGAQLWVLFLIQFHFGQGIFVPREGELFFGGFVEFLTSPDRLEADSGILPGNNRIAQREHSAFGTRDVGWTRGGERREDGWGGAGAGSGVAPAGPATAQVEQQSESGGESRMEATLLPVGADRGLLDRREAPLPGEIERVGLPHSEGGHGKDPELSGEKRSGGPTTGPLTLLRGLGLVPVSYPRAGYVHPTGRGKSLPRGPEAVRGDGLGPSQPSPHRGIWSRSRGEHLYDAGKGGYNTISSTTSFTPIQRPGTHFGIDPIAASRASFLGSEEKNAAAERGGEDQGAVGEGIPGSRPEAPTYPVGIFGPVARGKDARYNGPQRGEPELLRRRKSATTRRGIVIGGRLQGLR